MQSATLNAEYVPEFNGPYVFTPEEYHLHNTLGESFGVPAAPAKPSTAGDISAEKSAQASDLAAKSLQFSQLVSSEIIKNRPAPGGHP